MAHLSAAKYARFLIKGVKLLFGDWDFLIPVLDEDVILVLIDCHKKVLRFSISRNGGLLVLPQNGYRKPTAVLTEFSVSDCSKPAQKAATVFICPPDTVEPSVIGRCSA